MAPQLAFSNLTLCNVWPFMHTEQILRYRGRDTTAADVGFHPWFDCGASGRASPAVRAAA